jgi:hypothetical protein
MPTESSARSPKAITSTRPYPFLRERQRGVCACLASLCGPNQEVKAESNRLLVSSSSRFAMKDAWVLYRDAGQGAAVAP